jgi:hypothetical protein
MMIHQYDVGAYGWSSSCWQAALHRFPAKNIGKRLFQRFRRMWIVVKYAQHAVPMQQTSYRQARGIVRSQSSKQNGPNLQRRNQLWKQIATSS